MPAGRLPSRDYMNPDGPRRVRDYMSPRSNGTAHGVDGARLTAAPDGQNGAGGVAFAPNGGPGAPGRNGRILGGTNGASALQLAAVTPLPTAGDAPAAALVAPSPATAPPTPRAPGARKKATLGEVFASFALRDFRYLTLSTLAAGFAQWAKQIALFALAFDLTGSTAALGTVALFRGGVGSIIAPFGGYLADRFPRRGVVAGSTLADAVLAAALAALVLTDQVQIWHIYVIAFGGGLAQSINQPARQAFVYDVTTDETLPNAIAMNSMVQNISRVLGPSGLGMLMAAYGVGAGLVMLVVLQVIALVVTLMISRQTRQARVSSGESPLRLMWEGLRYSFSDRRILGLVVSSVIPSLLVYPYIPFLKVVSEEVLHKGTAGFGWLSSMMGWGSLLGLFLLAWAGTARHRGKIMIGCFMVYSTMLIGFAASSHYYLSLAILATAGIFHSVAMALNNILVQTTAKNELRGRVMSVVQMSSGLQPIGTAMMTVGITLYGVQVGIGVFMAIATVAFVLFALSWGSVRRMM